LFVHTSAAYQTWLALEDLLPYWSPYLNLQVFILAGCNVLNMAVTSWGAAMGTGFKISRLLQGKGGPLNAILGYGRSTNEEDGHAPLDSQLGDRVAGDMAKKIASGSAEYVRDWLELNKQHKAVGGWHAVGMDLQGYSKIDQDNGTIIRLSNLKLDPSGNPIRP
jgi:hypothetical protein